MKRLAAVVPLWLALTLAVSVAGELGTPRDSQAAEAIQASPINHPAYRDGCWDSTGVPLGVGGNHGLGECLAKERKGWTGAEFRCLSELWGRLESGWNQHAANPRSSAHGIPQALPGKKMGPGWRYDVRVQVNWGMDYVEGRYGSPCKAKTHRLKRGWY